MPVSAPATCARQPAIIATAQQLADARTIIAAVDGLADATHGPRAGRTRYVSVMDVRAHVGLPAWRFDRAITSLFIGHRLSGLFDFRFTSAAQDAASVLYEGTSRHLVTADDWRTSAPFGGRTLPLASVPPTR